MNAHARDFATGIHGQFRFGHMVAAMGIAQETFRAFARPLDWTTTDKFGGPDAGHFFAVNKYLGAKTAAHIWRDHAKLVFRGKPVEGRDHQTGHMWVLAGGIKRVTFGACIIRANRRAGFHGVWN